MDSARHFKLSNVEIRPTVFEKKANIKTDGQTDGYTDGNSKIYKRLGYFTLHILYIVHYTHDTIHNKKIVSEKDTKVNLMCVCANKRIKTRILSKT